MTEWQPIETAPKDGTDIWLGADGNGDARRERVSIGYWALKGEWRSYADDEQIVWRPTHWQPFLEPDPPSHEKPPELPGHNETIDGLSALTIRRST